MTLVRLALPALPDLKVRRATLALPGPRAQRDQLDRRVRKVTPGLKARLVPLDPRAIPETLDRKDRRASRDRRVTLATPGLRARQEPLARLVPPDHRVRLA